MTFSRDTGGILKTFNNTDLKFPDSLFYILMMKQVTKTRLASRAVQLYYLSKTKMSNMLWLSFMHIVEVITYM